MTNIDGNKFIFTQDSSPRSSIVSKENRSAVDDLVALYFPSDDGNSNTDGSAHRHTQRHAPRQFQGDIALFITRILREFKTKTNNFSMHQIEMYNGDMKMANMDSLRAALEAAENSAKAKKSGVFAKVFGWIALIATTLVAAITVNPVLIAAAIMAITMMVLQETGAMQKIAEALGPELFMALMIALVIASIAMMMFAPTTSLVLLPQALIQASTVVHATATVIDTVSTIGNGVSVMVGGGFKWKADELTYESEKAEAVSERIKTLIDEFIEIWKEMMDSIVQMINELIEMLERSHRAREYSIRYL